MHQLSEMYFTVQLYNLNQSNVIYRNARLNNERNNYNFHCYCHMKGRKKTGPLHVGEAVEREGGKGDGKGGSLFAMETTKI